MKKKSLNAKKIIHKYLINKLKNKKINKIYNHFEKNLNLKVKNGNLAGSISGGPDSLALAYFLKCYSLKHKKKIYYYHVDHKLRKNSHSEASKLKSILSKNDINCEILSWIGKKPKSNIQSVARKKRYQLIDKNINKNNVRYILTAHHYDDLKENFFIRMTRGSGLEGLVSFNSSDNRYSEKLSILRPLINVKKSDLDYTSKKVFNFAINDPSNHNESFKRVRIRKLIKKLDEEGLDTDKILLTINNLSESNIAINHFVELNLSNNTITMNNGKKFLINEPFFLNPNEIIFRSLSKILTYVGRKYYPPRGRSLSHLIASLKASDFQKTTLSSCIIEKVNNLVIIYKEK